MPDGGAATASVAGDGGAVPYAGPWLGATVLLAPVWSEMDWPNDKKGDKERDKAADDGCQKVRPERPETSAGLVSFLLQVLFPFRAVFKVLLQGNEFQADGDDLGQRMLHVHQDQKPLLDHRDR